MSAGAYLRPETVGPFLHHAAALQVRLAMCQPRTVAPPAGFDHLRISRNGIGVVHLGCADADRQRHMVLQDKGVDLAKRVIRSV